VFRVPPRKIPTTEALGEKTPFALATMRRLEASGTKNGWKMPVQQFAAGRRRRCK
jgi:hypothetical protein